MLRRSILLEISWFDDHAQELCIVDGGVHPVSDGSEAGAMNRPDMHVPNYGWEKCSNR